MTTHNEDVSSVVICITSSTHQSDKVEKNSSGQDVKHGGSMERVTRKQREEFIETLLSHIPDRVPATVNNEGDIAELVGTGTNWSWFHDGRPFAKRLMRYGATLGRIAENQCNGYQTWDGKEDERAAKREELKEQRIRSKVEELCKQWGCTPVFQGDPRGNVLKIQVPDGYTNDWGREGICVPTS